MNTPMNTDKTLGDIVATDPVAARIFHQHRLDFCCGGAKSLKEACAAENVDLDTVLGELEAAKVDSREEVRWSERPDHELIAHILERYHQPLRVDLEILIASARKVEEVHRDKPDCPHGLAKLLVEIRAAVESHLAKEEQILFPLILSGRGRNAYMPVQVMMQEHEDHGRNLRRIRELTCELTTPEYACATWRELYRALSALEVDLMDHIHLENNILFPRALAG